MPSRAVVLGGGGLAGIAWEVGVLIGLADAGIDVLDADLVVGTSAGSAVGAGVTSVEVLKQFYEAQDIGRFPRAKWRWWHAAAQRCDWTKFRSLCPRTLSVPSW